VADVDCDPVPAEARGVAPRVKVKVCGLTRVADALACAGAGVDWIGLNFHAGSLRRVDRAAAAAIVAALPAGVEAVGVFVDRPPAEVAGIARELGLRIVQLHGREPPEDLLALADRFIVRAYRLGDAADVARMVADLDACRALGRAPDAVLVDAYVPGQPGGTGQAIAAEVLAALPPRPRLILAGGLTPENVAARVAQVGPWMVDVASGVESAPGCKDATRVAEFVAAIHQGVSLRRALTST
jgi:phosphoribosylanthranilate isomerase